MATGLMHSKTHYYVVCALGKDQRIKSYVKIFYEEGKALSFAKALNCEKQQYVVYHREETEDLLYDGSKEFDRGGES